MKVLRVRVSEACDNFVNALQEQMGMISSQANLKAPIAPLNQVGKGSFFAGYREYTPADDSSLIDWKASIRANKTLIKKFEIRKTLDFIFVLDISASMLFSSGYVSKAEYAAEIVAALTFSALESGNSVGLLTFNDKVVKTLNPDPASSQLQAVLNQIVEVDSYGGGYDIEEPLKQLGGNIRNNTLVVIVSDFIGLKKDWRNSLSLIGTSSSIVGIMVRDPVDYSLDNLSGDFVFEDLYSKEKVVIDGVVKKRYEASAKKKVIDIETHFRLANALFFPFRTDKDFIDSLINIGGAW
jgi:uncharacterized protein (DUF58 family)